VKTLMRYDGSPGARDALRLACLLSHANDADVAIVAGPAGYDDAMRSLPYGFRPELVYETPSPGARVLVVGAGQPASERATGSIWPVAVAPHGFRDEPDAALRVIGVAHDGSPEARDALVIAESLAVKTGAVVRIIDVTGDDASRPELSAGEVAQRAGAIGLLVAPRSLAAPLLDAAWFPVLAVPRAVRRSTQREPVAAPDGLVPVLG
jgi:hypothetical protein